MRAVGRRTVAEPLAALAATGALAVGLPLAPEDPFRTSLLILPLVVASLRALERRGRHFGGRTVGAAARLEGPALALLVVVTLLRHRLGLTVTDGFLAAGYALLLAHRVARLVVGWRPCLGRRLPSRPPVLFFFLPLVCYLALQPWMSAHRQPDGDEPFYLLLTHSLAYDLDVDLANNYGNEDWLRFMSREIKPQPGDPIGPGGERLSRHSPLLPLFLVPAYRLAGRWGAMAMMALLAALTAWMVLRLARHYAPRQPGTALLAYAVFAFSPPFLLYSYQIWIEVPAAFLLTVALDGILALRRRRRRQPWRVALLVAALALLPLLKLRLGLLAIPLLFLAWLRARPGKQAMALVAGGLAVALGGLLAYNQIRFGNPLKMHSWRELGVFENAPADFLRGAVGMFYDTAFGLFPSAPIWCLLVPSLWLAVRRRSPQLLDFLIVSMPYLLAIWPRPEWFGGWSPPFRYPLVLLPLLALLLLPLLELRSRAGVRALLAATGAVTLILTVLWIVLPGWTYNFADGRTLILDHLGSRFQVDVARFFPSTIRPRAATWGWLAASLLLIPIAFGFRRRGRAAPLWGLSAVLLLLGASGWMAVRLPTRVIEFEDAQVRKARGGPVPATWTVNRPAYESGWAVPIGGHLTAPVVAGGGRVEIRLRARFVGDRGSRLLDFLAGEKSLGSLPVGRYWEDLVLGPVDWPAGEPLVIVGAARIPESGPDEAGLAPRSDPRSRVVLDRAELVWSDRPGGSQPP